MDFKQPIMNVSIPDGIDTTELVKLLHGPYPIPPVDIFPLGIFWISLIGIIICYFIYRILYPKGKSLSLKFLIKIEFKKINKMIKSNESNREIVLELSKILRRTGVCSFGHQAVASLYGKSWENFIIEHDKTRTFKPDVITLLANAPYIQGEILPSTGIDDIYKQTYNWSMAQL